MDHLTYLDRYHELTTAALAEIALLHGREDWSESATALTALRVQQDAMWDAYRASAGELVKP